MQNSTKTKTKQGFSHLPVNFKAVAFFSDVSKDPPQGGRGRNGEVGGGKQGDKGGDKSGWVCPHCGEACTHLDMFVCEFFRIFFNS